MNLQVGNFQIFKHEVDPSMSRVSEIAPCPPSPVANNPSALPALT